MKKLSLVLLIFAAFTGHSAHSASLIVMDDDLKNTLTAEIISIDGSNQVLTASGEVSLIRSLREIYGGTLRVYRENGTQINQASIQGTEHQRALLLQRGVTELRVCADKIEYYPLKEVAYLYGSSQIFHGNKLFEAASMEYLIDQELVNATCEGCRVRITSPATLSYNFCDRPVK